MFTQGDSYFKVLAETTRQWIPGDSLSVWEAHMTDPNKRSLLDKLGWTAENISYRFNRYGFRSDEFEGEGTVFLGCSLTMGVGIDWERTWVYQVATALGTRCWNLGNSGAANDTCFRLANYWLPILKPKRVCMLSTFNHRIELITPEQIVPLKNHEDGPFIRQWIEVNDNCELNELKNIMAIQLLCNKFGIDLTIKSVYDRVKDPDDLGRDLLHRGPKWNMSCAEDFLKVIK
jgi:hypothetical protein